MEDADRTVVTRAVAFVLLTYAISFSVYGAIVAADRGWIEASVPSQLAALAVFGPAIAAAVLRLRARGRAGLERMLAEAARWRFGRGWWVATLGVPLVLVGGTYAVYLLIGGTFQLSATAALLRGAGGTAAVAVPVFAVLTTLLAYGEEAEWRGYLLPVLQTRWSALTASLVLGVAWFVWHLPLVALPGGENAGFPIPLWLVAIVSMSIVYAWLYNNTGGSVLAVTLFHAGVNVWDRLVALHPSETGETISAVLVAGSQLLLAVVLVVTFGGASLTRTRGRGRPDRHSDASSRP